MKRSRLNPRSARKEAELKVYNEIRDLVLQNSTHCARCHLRHDHLEPHHPYLRGSGKAVWKQFVVIPLCNECHRFVHDNPNLSRTQGWLVKTPNH